MKFAKIKTPLGSSDKFIYLKIPSGEIIAIRKNPVPWYSTVFHKCKKDSYGTLTLNHGEGFCNCDFEEKERIKTLEKMWEGTKKL